MGKSKRGKCGFNCSEAGQAHDLSGRQKKNRSRAAGAVGEGTRCEQEGGLAAREPAVSYAAGFPSCLIQKICPEKQPLATAPLATSAHRELTKFIETISQWCGMLRRDASKISSRHSRRNSPEANELNAVRWVVKQRCWMCSLLFLFSLKGFLK
jgi:hypothetical protein